jgi:hypothetical protein
MVDEAFAEARQRFCSGNCHHFEVLAAAFLRLLVQQIHGCLEPGRPLHPPAA